MALYQDLLEQTDDKEKVKDYILEKTSDLSKELTEQGQKPEDIYKYIADKVGAKVEDLYQVETTKHDDTFPMDIYGKKVLIEDEYKTKEAILDNKLEEDESLKNAIDIQKNKLQQEKIDKLRKEDDEFMKTKSAPVVSEEKTEDDSDFFSSVKDFASAITEPVRNNPALQLALHKAQSVGSAMGQTVEAGVNKVFSSDFDFYEENSNRLKEEGIRLNQSIDPYGKLGLKPTQMTDLFASIVVPLKVTNPKKMVALEAFLGYTTEMSESGEIGESLKQGVYQSSTALVGTVVVEKFISMINKKGTGSALDYLWDKHEDVIREASGLPENATKDQIINSVEKDWLSIMSGSESNNNKVRALIDRMGRTGAEYKQGVQIITDTPKEKIVRDPKYQRVSELRSATKGGDIEGAAEELGKQVGVGELKTAETIDDLIIAKDVSSEVKERYASFIGKKIKRGKIAETYNNFVTAMRGKYKGALEVDEDAISKVSSNLEERARLSKGLSGAELNIAESLSQPMTIDNALSIKKDINSLIDSSKGIAKTNAVRLRGQLDKILKNTLDEPDRKLLKDLDTEWKNRSAIVGKKDINKLGAKLMSMVNKKSTVESVVKELDTLNTGEDTFFQLEKVIGTNNMKKIEKGIVDNLLNGNVDDISYSVINDSLTNLGFRTPEGKELKKIINKMNTVFSADNFTAIAKQSMGQEKDSVALTANLLEKLKYSASSAIFKRIKKAFFSSKDAQELRDLEKIADILTEGKVYSKRIVLGGKSVDTDDVVEVVRDAMFNAYNSQIKVINSQSKVEESAIKEAIDLNLGLGKHQGGKAARVNNSKDNGDYLKSLYNTKEEQKEVAKVVDTYGIKSSDKPTKAKSNYDKGAKEWFASLTNKQKEEVVETIEVKKDRTKGYNLSSLYEDGLTKYKKANNNEPSYSDISDSMFGTKKEVEVSKEGNLGMTSSYGGKAKSSNGVNTVESKEKLKSFLEDVANPKMEVKQDYIQEMESVLKNDGKLVYAFSKNKKQAYNKLRAKIAGLRKLKTVNASQKKDIASVIKDYLDAK